MPNPPAKTRHLPTTNVFAGLSRSIRWVIGSAGVLLLVCGALGALSPLNYVPPHPGFFTCLMLLTLFCMAWTALIVSLISWVCCKFFR